MRRVRTQRVTELELSGQTDERMEALDTEDLQPALKIAGVVARGREGAERRSRLTRR